MEEWQKDHIRDNGTYLYENTICDERLMTNLKERKKLAPGDIEILEAINERKKFKRNMELYGTLGRKKGGYSSVILALRDCEQDGPADLLLEGYGNRKLPAELNASGSRSTANEAASSTSTSKRHESEESEQEAARPKKEVKVQNKKGAKRKNADPPPSSSESENVSESEENEPKSSNDEMPEVVTMADVEDDAIDPFSVSVVKSKGKRKLKNDYYNLPKEGKGCALIVNVTEFKAKEKNRRGARCDTQYMKDLLTQLGWDTEDSVHEGHITKEDFKKYLKAFKNKIQKTDKSCAVYIGSHGCYPDKILMSDMTPLDLHDDIVYQFDSKNCSKLKGKGGEVGKPKIFIVNACRVSAGTRRPPPAPTHKTKRTRTRVKEDSLFDVETDSTRETGMSDAIVCYSTIPKYVSYRNGYGSFYTRCLTKTFMKNAHCKHLHELLQMTKDEMKRLDAKYKADQKHAQVSTYSEIDLDATKLYLNV